MKTKLILAAMLLSLVSLSMRAQRPAPVVGARLSMEVAFPGGGYDYYKTGAGVTVGPSVKLPLTRQFFFEPSLLFSYTGFSSKYLVKFSDDYLYQGSANLYSLRLPLEVGYDFNFGGLWQVNVATGPRINFNMSARQSLTPNFEAPVREPSTRISLFDYGWKRVDAQWGIRLSVTFAQHYFIGIDTGVAFTPFAKYGDRDKKIRIYRNTIAVTLGFNF